MPRILVLFAHPLVEKSRVHTRLAAAVRKIRGVTFHDLYELYPDFDIDVEEEQKLLLAHDIIIFQHPFYWYSAPPIIKQWLDLVLTYGWAYGRNGVALTGKYAMQVVSAGGKMEMYSATGRNRFTVRQFLAPFDQSFRLCHMSYLPPFIVHGTHRLGIPEIETAVKNYIELIEAMLENRISPDQLLKEEYIDGNASILTVNTSNYG